MPIDYKKYPPNWKELRKQVLERAENKCEFCGVENGTIGFRDKDGKFFELENSLALDTDWYSDMKVIKIVLTISHLDHDETNHEVSIDRLKALCQKCHLNYDVKEKKHRKIKKKAMGFLL
jgi:hypothetical protein